MYSLINVLQAFIIIFLLLFERILDYKFNIDSCRIYGDDKLGGYFRVRCKVGWLLDVVEDVAAFMRVGFLWKDLDYYLGFLES
jgi:hypothetical protein